MYTLKDVPVNGEFCFKSLGLDKFAKRACEMGCMPDKVFKVLHKVPGGAVIVTDGALQLAIDKETASELDVLQYQSNT